MKSFFYKFILPPILLGIVGVLSFGVARQVNRNYKLYTQVGELGQDVESLLEKNEQFRAQIDNFQDPSTIDKEARKRLNLKKDGEEVVIILPSQKKEDTTPEEEFASDREKQNLFWEIIKSWFE